MNDAARSLSSAPGRRIARTVAFLAIVVSVTFFLRDAQRSPDTKFDDAYMTLRYAKNFLAGHGLAWDPGGEQTLGTTSILHCAALAAIRSSLPNLSDANVLKLSSVGGGLLAVLLMTLSCASISRSEHLHGAYLIWGGLLCPMILFNGMFRYHGLTGMDTTLGMACNALLIGVALRAAYRGTVAAIVPTVIAGYLAYLARPDSGLYVALFPALAIFFIGPRENRIRRVLIFWGAMGGVLIADAFAKILVFGDPFPLSFYMKSHAFKTGYAGISSWNTAGYFMLFVGTMIPFICTGLVLVERRNARLLLPFLIPLALTLAYSFTTVQVMGFRARFYAPSIPFVIMAAAMLLDDQTANGEYTFRVHAVLTRLTTVLLLIVGMPIASYHFTTRYAEAVREPIDLVDTSTYYRRGASSSTPALEWWDSIMETAAIARRLPAGATMAMTELGLISASAPKLTIIDPIGLHDRYFAHHGFSATVFLDREPDLIWMPHPHYVTMLRALLESERFWAEYEVYSDMLNFGMAVRKSSPHAGVIHTLIHETWARVYPSLDIRSYRATRSPVPTTP